MPPVVIAAGIAAAGTLAGKVIESRGASGAAKTQASTADKSLAFAREQEAAKKASYDQAMKQYEAKWNAWQGQRTALLQRYGVDIAPPTMPGTGAATGSQPTAGPTQTPGIPEASRPATAGVQGLPGGLGALAMTPAEQAQGSPAMAEAAGLPKWNDWAGLGLQA